MKIVSYMDESWDEFFTTESNRGNVLVKREGDVPQELFDRYEAAEKEWDDARTALSRALADAAKR